MSSTNTVVPAAFDLNTASTYCGLSADVLRRAIRSNDLPAYYPTSKPMVKRRDLDAWIESWPATSPKERRPA